VKLIDVDEQRRITGESYSFTGESYSFTCCVKGRGSATARYQWYNDGDPMENETLNVLSLEKLSLTDSGEYFCEVTTWATIKRSCSVTLSVKPRGWSFMLFLITNVVQSVLYRNMGPGHANQASICACNSYRENNTKSGGTIALLTLGNRTKVIQLVFLLHLPFASLHQEKTKVFEILSCTTTLNLTDT